MMTYQIRKFLAKVLRSLLVVEIAGLVICVFTQVFSRYVLQNSVPWTEELARYILVYMTFTGTALAAHDNSHITVDFFVQILPTAMQRALHRIADLLMCVVAVVLLYYGWRFTDLSRETVSPALDQSMAWVYAAMPCAGVLMLIYGVLRLFERATPPKSVDPGI
jgi:TRAP-type C4-dicarboxylate transport system permease small subunit